MFTEMLQNGLAAGGWVIGLVAALGIFLLVVGVIGYVIVAMLNDGAPMETDENEKEANDDDDHR